MLAEANRHSATSIVDDTMVAIWCAAGVLLGYALGLFLTMYLSQNVTYGVHHSTVIVAEVIASCIAISRAGSSQRLAVLIVLIGLVIPACTMCLFFLAVDSYQWSEQAQNADSILLNSPVVLLLSELLVGVYWKLRMRMTSQETRNA